MGHEIAYNFFFLDVDLLKEAGGLAVFVDIIAEELNILRHEVYLLVQGLRFDILDLPEDHGSILISHKATYIE